MLESISQPSDLRSLSLEELTTLSEEIRSFILEKVSQTGGHLSPNLGVVELTLALHRVFESPAIGSSGM
jgi:1-deoxy-D-xylulose-5-phosphate synthase